MATLHLVNKAAALQSCLRVAAADDVILLLEDGVYAAVGEHAPERTTHALEVDVTARGLHGRLAPQIVVTSDAGFVALVEAHHPVVTWRS
jgi:tRNA 2-thiouridine synthesizing protein B